MAVVRAFLSSRLTPFQSFPFRQFFLVQSISLIGLWAFDMARAWIVVDGLGKAAALGVVMMASAIPPLFFSLYAGVMADRMDIRKVVVATKAGLALLSLLLALIVEFRQIELWHLILFSFLQGCVNAFDGPTFHSLTVRLVPTDDFQQAIALNSSNFHLSRALGPIVAGILMAVHGPSLVFLFDSVSYFGLIFVLRKVRFRDVREESGEPPVSDLTALKEGLFYFFRHPTLRYQLLQLFAALCLMFPMLAVVLRTYIKLKFSLNSDEFSYIFSLPAVGSAMGAISFALYLPKVPMKGLLLGVPLAVLSVAIVPFTDTALHAGFTMMITGFALYLCFASLTVSLNLAVEEKFRGRLGSLLTLGFFSIGPLMSYPVGAVADHVGYEISLLGFAAAFAVISLLLFGLYKR